MQNTLDGQVAIVSGGLGDIGRAIAAELAKHGAKIAVGDLRECDETFLKSLPTQSRYDRVDVSDSRQVEAWVKTVEANLGVPTLIVPNAAIVTVEDFATISPEKWDRELSINLNGSFYMAQAAVKRLLHHQLAGRVVFIGSWAAHAAHNSIPAYCVAKAGLRMLCKCMAVELAAKNILVNEVAPGYVDAGLTAELWRRNPGAKEKAQARVPTNQLITADEVAMQVMHLCDPRNRHMTGTTILMDGGLSLVTPAKK